MNNPEYVKIGEKKYKINTDFRVAIECDKIARDEDIKGTEKSLAIIYKLFGDEGLNSPEDYEQLLKLGLKYLSMGNEIEDDDKEEPDMDFEQDMDYIYTSFMSDYGMDISKENMHWWTFMNLMNGLSNSELGNCCVLNRIRNLRNMDPSEIKDKKERDKIIKAQKKVALKRNQPKLSDEQIKSAEELYKSLGI